MSFVIILFFCIFLIAKSAKKKEEEEAKKNPQKSTVRSTVNSSATRTASSAPAPQKKISDPVSESYNAAREALLSLYRSGQINEEEMMMGNQTLYDQYLAEPMKICNTLRAAGVFEQAKIEDDGDYAIFFTSEQAAWNACNSLQRSGSFKLVSDQKKATADWAFLPFENSDYRIEVLIDKKIGLQKMVVRDKNGAAPVGKKITAEELEKLQIEAFDFSH